MPLFKYQYHHSLQVAEVYFSTIKDSSFESAYQCPIIHHANSVLPSRLLHQACDPHHAPLFNHSLQPKPLALFRVKHSIPLDGWLAGWLVGARALQLLVPWNFELPNRDAITRNDVLDTTAP